MKIPDILYKFARQEASPEEIQAFSAWLNTLNEAEYRALTDQYGEIVRKAGKPGPPDKALFSQIKEQIEEGMQPAETSPTFAGKTPGIRRLRRIYYYPAAAVLLLGLAVPIYFLLHNKKASGTKETQRLAVIPPGSNKAILTLAGGQQFVLDEAGRGHVASLNGARAVKLDSGVIAWQAVQEDGEAEATEQNGGKDRPMERNGRLVEQAGRGDRNDRQTGRNSGIADQAWNTITTPRGGQYQLILPDGSHVWLNAASSLRFPTAFGSRTREVELSGEGYFEIAADPGRPFSVHTRSGKKELQVLALGTSFNIGSYPDEPATEATLVTGSVQVSQEGSKTLLVPGRMAVSAHTGGDAPAVRTADLEEVLAWKNGQLSLSNAGLAKLMREISRWYDVDIHYAGPVPDKRFFGLLNRNVNLSTILGFLRKNGLEIRQEGRDITVTNKPDS